ncbi:helix-turn-helix domain-containing protein [Nostocoides jenkinsii]|uniref:DNA-binding protein, excisionase family n=1 Tax=Nostocoides jenkinsii Ben 74 TaxID=1193518 RepID=A0A077M312_9MICO|nr:helix-turn-helix domain-containing protein [Tetrasphaera jenkinsii]CCI51546.1 DNA-binding protein, excisionase family [Tetrasphaera jenkinsii Ben 74]
MPTALESQTYLPADSVDLDPIEALLADESSDAFALVGPGGRVPIPAEVHKLLLQVVQAMHSGHSITVSPQTQRLTTQQAAELLGISRPTLIKLIERGEIPCQRNSSRRTIQLKDVMDYRKQRRERQLAAIAATSVDLDDDDLDTIELRALMKEARRANALRRSAGS